MKNTPDGAALALAVLLAAAAETLILALLGSCPAAPAPAPAAPRSRRVALDHWAELAARREAQLEPLTVAQLRTLARAAGLPRTLTHRGRRAALLQALAGVDVAMV